VTVFDTALFNTHLAAEVAEFQAEKFLGDKGLRNLDRGTRFLCSAAKLALDDANLAITEQNSEDIGVVTATTLSAMWNIVEFSRELAQEGPQFVNPAFFPGTTMNAPSSQVSIRFKIKGFNTTVSTGYTASIDALKYAVDFIKLGRAKAVLVAGVESLTFENYVGFYKLNFLAGINGEEISCPFDKRRNGMILGEGSAVLMIEDEDFAKERNARIYACIPAVETMFDAFRTGKFEPHAQGLKRTMQKVLKESGLDKDSIDCILAAANSGAQQDRLETEAIKEVFKEKAPEIPVSSIKSMLGESFSASGLLQMAAAVGSIQNGIIPPTVNYQDKDPDCDLDYVTEGARQKRIGNILINSFGPGGSNASVILSK
ncbi:MAG: beta-ketoacyl-[acyl-carrier-protein] synthase family protein, partial [Candidatus Omnitrophica bacterium]|nr:beta-ketoacyl-[acyl-carrier-protein] synthase family protein [Candidatus Omnitrophota bacterium]